MFADRLRTARNAKNLTKEDAAKRCGIHPSRWGAVENWKPDPSKPNAKEPLLTSEQLRAVSKHLQVSIDWLLETEMPSMFSEELRQEYKKLSLPSLEFLRHTIFNLAHQEKLIHELMAKKK